MEFPGFRSRDKVSAPAESQKRVFETHHIPGAPDLALVGALARLGMTYMDAPIEEGEPVKETARFQGLYQAQGFGISLEGSVIGEITSSDDDQIAARLVTDESTFPILPKEASFVVRRSGENLSSLRVMVDGISWDGRARGIPGPARGLASASFKSMFGNALVQLPALMHQPVEQSPVLKFVKKQVAPRPPEATTTTRRNFAA